MPPLPRAAVDMHSDMQCSTLYIKKKKSDFQFHNSNSTNQKNDLKLRLVGCGKSPVTRAATGKQERARLRVARSLKCKKASAVTVEQLKSTAFAFGKHNRH